MRVDLFDFELPPDRIADRPCAPRDQARLLYVSDERCHDSAVHKLPGLLRRGDIMVFNDTRVIPARLLGHRGAVAVEFLLHKQLTPDTWEGFARPAKRLRPGQCIDFQHNLSAEVLSREGPTATVRFNLEGSVLMAAFKAAGHVPLPPYIRRSDDARDRSDYQTVYATKEGAVAAPTAGLHFTPELLESIDNAGIQRALVTLHVGAGTFLPVAADDTSDHKMHAEWGEVSAVAATAINTARQNGGRIVAVGTTSLRLLETAADTNGIVHPFTGETSLFIMPGYRFKTIDMLMTNFHLPRSTLYMLVCAFAGTVTMKKAYEHAISSGYRFYSYGDASLLQRSSSQ
jgi:S-adenosylmethionine:tRNA ribosyltransferase-isomerase